MPRIEEIIVGEHQVRVTIDDNALWGAETQLALEHYQTTGQLTPKPLLRAIFLIKKAAALAHKELGAIKPKIANSIAQAADEALEGKLDEHFPLDVINSGAGTSLNMNVNEVLANRARQLMRGRKLKVDPHNHVNMGQSTNDVMPTAMRISIFIEFTHLINAALLMRDALKQKAQECWVPTTARTHIRDALPITMGARFLGYASEIEKVIHNMSQARLNLCELGIGATAVGTGANAVPGYRDRMIQHLSEFTGIRFSAPPYLYGATGSMADFLSLNAAIRILALVLQPIIKDLELLSSGPNTGFIEIKLPSVQPGSSIMPGKVNPSALENLSMACAEAEGNCHTVDVAAALKQFELNPRMPVMAWNILQAIETMKNSIANTVINCIKGITVHEERCRIYYENSSAWFTILNGIIGYQKAARLRLKVLQELEKSGSLNRIPGEPGETILKALIRVAQNLNIKTKDGSPITEKILERLAFPKNI